MPEFRVKYRRRKWETLSRSEVVDQESAEEWAREDALLDMQTEIARKGRAAIYKFVEKVKFTGRGIPKRTPRSLRKKG